MEQGDKLHFKQRDNNLGNVYENKRHFRKIRKAIGVNNEFAKSDKLPKFDRSKYYTRPSYLDMCRMSENELSS